MPEYDPSVWRILSASSLTVASAAGAAASSAAFNNETWAIDLAFTASTTATGPGAVRIAVVSPQDAAVSSTTGTLLPSGWIQRYKVTPGQRVSAISNDATTPALSITELTK